MYQVMKFNNFALPKEVRDGAARKGGAVMGRTHGPPPRADTPPPCPSPCPQAFYMVRFHSFYPWHAHGDYLHLCSEEDLRMLPWVRELKCVTGGNVGGFGRGLR